MKDTLGGAPVLGGVVDDPLPDTMGLNNVVLVGETVAREGNDPGQTMMIQVKGVGWQLGRVLPEDLIEEILDPAVGRAEVSGEKASLFLVALDEEPTEADAGVVVHVTHRWMAKGHKLQVCSIDGFRVVVGAGIVVNPNA